MFRPWLGFWRLEFWRLSSWYSGLQNQQSFRQLGVLIGGLSYFDKICPWIFRVCAWAAQEGPEGKYMALNSEPPMFAKHVPRLNIHTHLSLYIYTYFYVHTYIHTCMHVSIHVYIYIYICIYACLNTYVCICTHTYIHTYMHACMHACIYT